MTTIRLIRNPIINQSGKKMNQIQSKSKGRMNYDEIIKMNQNIIERVKMEDSVYKNSKYDGFYAVYGGHCLDKPVIFTSW